MDTRFCQSCGMPLRSTEDYGTNVDQSPNTDFCHYCYQDGNFTRDVTMDMMIEQCAQFLDEYNEDAPQKLTREEAIAQMQEYFPQLKRWKEGQ